MRLSAVTKAGLGNGLLVALATHWLFWEPLAELVYGIELPGLLSAGLGVLATLVLLAGTLTIGVRAVRLAGASARTGGKGLAVGAGAGLLAGLCVYLTVAVIGSALVLGGEPLVHQIMGAIELDAATAREALLQAARDAAPEPPLVMAGALVFGGLLGGLEGLVYSLFLRRQESSCTGAE